jgi:hypothetical protein
MVDVASRSYVKLVREFIYWSIITDSIYIKESVNDGIHSIMALWQKKDSGIDMFWM